jgi:hypothetical protein
MNTAAKATTGIFIVVAAFLHLMIVENNSIQVTLCT